MKTQFSIARPLGLILATIFIGFGMLKTTATAVEVQVIDPDAPPIYWVGLAGYNQIIQRLDGSDVQDIVVSVMWSVTDIALGCSKRQDILGNPGRDIQGLGRKNHHGGT